MDDFANNSSLGIHSLSEVESRREWFVGVLGGGICYGLILWLC